MTASQRDAALASLAKALGHTARVRILRFLAARSGCICGAIVDEIGLAQSTVSQHLAILKRAGLVQGEIDGPRVCYCLVPGVLERLGDMVAELAADKARPACSPACSPACR